MNVIVNIDSQKFSFDGVPYFKNFMPHVLGTKLAIVNVYDSKLKLCDYENFANFSVDGVVHGSVEELTQALLPILFTRASLGMISGTTNWGDIEGDVLDQTDLIDLLALNFYPRSSNPNGYLTSANWGSIAGSITSQTDLIALLNTKQNNPLYLSQVDDFSLLNTTAQQRIFSGGVDADGGIPIVAGTRYLIRADINFIELSASVSKSLNIGFLGTSAASELSIFIWGIITNNTGLATVQMARMENYVGVLSASSSLASFGRIHMSGILECSTSGKLIPTVQTNVSGVGGKTKKGSTFLAIPLGPISSSHN